MKSEKGIVKIIGFLAILSITARASALCIAVQSDEEVVNSDPVEQHEEESDDSQNCGPESFVLHNQSHMDDYKIYQASD